MKRITFVVGLCMAGLGSLAAAQNISIATGGTGGVAGTLLCQGELIGLARGLRLGRGTGCGDGCGAA